tara:strand:+ start:2802 stop:3098 length:297 start_codon:yes stop_codon:yes gene_type:complete
MEEIQKKLIIKKKILKRLQNECKFYEKEIVELENLIRFFNEFEPENYEVNKKKEILEETQETLKVVVKKTQEAEEDLYNYIEEHLEDGMITNDLICDI